MDYSLSEALRTTKTDMLPKALVLYDIMCQFMPKLHDRFARHPQHLSIPPELTIEPGIGLFHVHGHQDTCFARYAPTLIKGAGQVDGEILETLWSVLNEISPMTQTATLAHRSEVLDDHMNDSNWKKLVTIGVL